MHGHKRPGGNKSCHRLSQQHIWILFRLLQLHVMWALRPLVKDSFQEVDIKGITMPITKHNYIVKDVNQLADTIRKSFVIAKSGRPGPVHIDITKDVTEKKAEYIYEEPKEPKSFPVKSMKQLWIKRWNLFSTLKKPFVLSAAVSSVQMLLRNLKSLSAKSHAPVADSLMGKGAFDGNDRAYTGMIGMHRHKNPPISA